MVRRRYAAYTIRDDGRILFTRHAWTRRGAEVRAARMYEACREHGICAHVTHGRRADW